MFSPLKKPGSLLMLNILGSKIDLCDGLSRRNFLQIGSLAMGGLTLPQLLAAERNAGIRNSRKAVIMIYMVGAPPHQDMYDLKMDAPAEIRGEFQPIETAVPGIRISEYMPGIAGIMDKCIPLRSVHGSPNGGHDSYICYTGRAKKNEPPGGWPSMGSIISRLRGPSSRDVPPFIGLAPDAGHPPYGSPGLPGFLGVRNAAFRPSGPASKDMVLNSITPERLDSRSSLLKGFDAFRRKMDLEAIYDGLDKVTQQALGILTSSRLAEAMDVSREPAEVLNLYGCKPGDGSFASNCLLARRLAERGVRFIQIMHGSGAAGAWDQHSNLKAKHSELAMQVDRPVAGLLKDLKSRGMLDETLVVFATEFGRTPGSQGSNGRDHHPYGFSVWMAGGGLKGGLAHGTTDEIGFHTEENPHYVTDVHATLLHQLGLEPERMEVPAHKRLEMDFGHAIKDIIA